MNKIILITGSTDGIGKATAKAFIKLGHRVLLHGRSVEKLASVKEELSSEFGEANIEAFAADLSDFNKVRALAEQIAGEHQRIDVLINNAGVYKVANKTADNGIDVRFVVNTISPYLLTLSLMPLLGRDARVINLSSAAQAPVDISALGKANYLTDDLAYAQSKLALTMWSRHMAETQGAEGPAIIAVNPASFLGSNMVKEAYGMEGKDLQIGVDVLSRAALSDEFSDASGLYFDNDKGVFSDPHPDVLNSNKNRNVVNKLDEILA